MSSNGGNTDLFGVWHPAAGPREYVHDHVRIEHMLADGTQSPLDGALHPDRSRPGLQFKGADAAPYAI